MTHDGAPGSDDPGDPAQSGEAPEEVDPADILDGTGAARIAAAPGSSSTRWRGWWKFAAAAAALVLVMGGVYAYRSHQQRRIVDLSISRARALVRSDTWLGYERAAELLGVRAAELEPVRAGSLRALALALLAADYRDATAAADANGALKEPLRAAEVPLEAELAVAALALREGKAGTALEYAGRGSGRGLADVLAARAALVAGNVSAAGEALDRGLAADPQLPAALALRGDLLRRAGRSAEARVAYAAALEGSGRALEAGLAGSGAGTGPHARATFGLAKLALGRELSPDEALGPLRRLAADGAGTAPVERARAALYLAALQARGGDRTGAAAALDAPGLEPQLRGWMQQAAGQLEVERGHYRVPSGTPAALVSASDDDPYLPPPPPPAPRVEPPPKPVLHGFKVHPVVKKPPRKGAAAAKRQHPPSSPAKAKAKAKAKANAKAKAKAKKPPADKKPQRP
jgi:tetratricopeptide (TPR) repeat protein